MTTEIAELETENLPAVVEHVEPRKEAADYRTESVAHALDAAYARASLLELTADEAKALAADFPDEAFRLGAGGDPDLIYIEHAYLRRRLNEVLGVGAAVPIRRREWAENFTYIDRYKKQQQAVRVYVDIVLVVRGCVVGEAIGDSVYYPSNSKTNYSDALEAAKSNAFRRTCKEFGVGLQAWMKGWGEGWKARQRGERPRQEKPADNKPETNGEPLSEPPNWPDSSQGEIKLWIESLKRPADFAKAVESLLTIPNSAQRFQAIKLLSATYHLRLAAHPDRVESLATTTDNIALAVQIAEKADLESQGEETFK